MKEPVVLTDHNSLYRKLYNRSLDFFKWVIDREKPPYIFKLHVQAFSAKEIKIPMVKRSIEFLIPHSQQKPKIDIQFFSKKKQFKAFVEIQDASVAKHFFTHTFSAKNLALLDNDLNVAMSREMRSYLVKTEE